MPSSSLLFFISLALLSAMMAGKWVSLNLGRQGLISKFLGRFDLPLSTMIRRLSVLLRVVLMQMWHYSSVFVHHVHHIFAAYVHFLIQTVERRVRHWREFAREQKIERKSASLFIQDVVDYKNALKRTTGPHKI